MIKIVISGSNFTSGGPLSVMQDLLNSISKDQRFKVIALVHQKSLYDLENLDSIEFIEFTDSKSSWFKRLKYEYYDFSSFSREIKPDIWLSMHDITPNVHSKLLFTYCHNPAPFYKFQWKDFSYDKTFALFTLFYKYLYKINIQKNDFVFVQQNWIKEAFRKMFKLSNVIVAKPNITIDISNTDSKLAISLPTFIYPAFPRVFKNFEVICRAVEHLETTTDTVFKIILTIDGTENSYALDIVNKYKHLQSIHFTGLLTRNEIFKQYNLSSMLIFPSKLETWGLPISEYKAYNKPMLIADLPYAKETVGNYDKVNFFDPDDYQLLAMFMQQHIDKTLKFQGNLYKKQTDLHGWKDFNDFMYNQYLQKNKEI